MSEDIKLTGQEVDRLLTQWMGRSVPAERALAAWAKRPTDAEWEQTMARRAEALDAELSDISHMRLVSEMTDRVAGWSDELVIALISRVGHRMKPLKREHADRAMLTGPGGIHPLGPAIRLFLLGPAIFEETLRRH